MGDGLISSDEFFVGMQTLGFEGPKEVIDELFTTLDGPDGNDTIECALHLDPSALPHTGTHLRAFSPL
eukprot:2828951-Prymnesium_polylepis.1